MPPIRSCDECRYFNPNNNPAGGSCRAPLPQCVYDNDAGEESQIHYLTSTGPDGGWHCLIFRAAKKGGKACQP
jgi:hypothetical protein